MEIKQYNFSKFLDLPRQIKVVFMILIDISLCCLSVWISYYLRIGNFSSPIEWMMFPFLSPLFFQF